ncbi:hypothetical protein EHS25_004663 [Saitozyma podzolica]|uniref:CENP-C homolog n=1 Tax=Saitozyma podzolica TaxID=1890683 RepID=A0A427YUT5_9TREE|nr:hypothetical protein EHS25_004663 [Saitozyma podzolica]
MPQDMPPSTPGRAARAAARAGRYSPFNARPKEVGVRTGQTMPTNLPRNSMGFEDPEEFFRSPDPVEARIARDIASYIRTPRSGSGGGGGIGARSTVTPGTTHSSAGPSRRTRMSDLGGDDLEDEIISREGLVVDDDFGDIDHPTSYFSDNNPPSVSIPRKSLLPPASPAVDYDGIPSPSKTSRRSTLGAKSSGGVNSSPIRRRILHSPPVDMNGNGHDELEMVDDFDTTLASQDLQQGAAESDEDEDTGAGVEMGRNANRGRLSTMSKRSRATMGGDEDEDGGATELGEPSIRYDAGEGEDDVGMDFAADVGGYEDEDEGGADLEEEAVAREDEDEDEDENDQEEEEDTVRPKKGQAKKKTKPAPVRREKRQVEQPTGPKSKRMRVSQMGTGDDGAFEGDFRTRRSQRAKFTPLEWWRGEKFNWKRGEYGAQIEEVVKLQPDYVEPLAARNKKVAGRTGRGRSRSTARRSASVDPNREVEGWDELTNPIGVVNDWPQNKEIERRIAYPKNLLDPKEVKDGNFKYQKVFGEDQFIAAGVVYVPIGCKKPGKHSKDNSYVFFVVQGAVQVQVHRTSFVMAPGAMFMVPRGNHYSIENISPDAEAQLFFAQARKVPKSELEEEGRALAEAQSLSGRGSATPKGKRKGKLPAVAEEQEEEGQEEEEEEEAERPKTKKAKVKGKKR